MKAMIHKRFMHMLRSVRRASHGPAGSLIEALCPRSWRSCLTMMDFYSQFIQEGDLCFDVGANFGNRTEVFWGLGAKVLCIEPQHACLIKLRSLFKGNKDIIIIDTALGEREGVGELAICADEPTISTMSDKWKNEGRFSTQYCWSQTETVAITTLDALIETYGFPKFCKIDVEGFEEPVLKGLSRPIPYISFEFTREFFEDTKKCITHLLSIAPAQFNCSLGESMEMLLPEWGDASTLYTTLDSCEDEFLWGDIYVRY